MVGWDDLPTVFKKEVAKKLDVMSRHAMRCTSRQDRTIVDSTEFYIPRVRLTIKDEDKCMITIYTGIEKFLRMEFHKGSSDGTIIHSMENSYDLKDATIKVIPSSVPIQIAFSILKTLFIHKTVLLGALELELSDPFETKPRRISEKMIEIIGDFTKIENLFRAKRLVINSLKILTDDVPYSLIYCNHKICEDVEHNLLQFFDSYVFPRAIFEKNSDGGGEGRQYHDTLMWMTDGLFNPPKKLYEDAMEAYGYATCRFTPALLSGETIWNFQKVPITKLNNKVKLKRIVNEKEGFVVRYNMSECGLWIHMMKTEKEKQYLDFFKKETCGLRWMCKKCSDPFEYWFYQTLPRRLYYEPEWIDIRHVEGEEIPVVNDEMLEEMKRMKENQMKMKKSWGFRSMEDRADSVVDSDDVKTSEVSGEKEDVKVTNVGMKTHMDANNFSDDNTKNNEDVKIPPATDSNEDEVDVLTSELKIEVNIDEKLMTEVVIDSDGSSDTDAKTTEDVVATSEVSIFVASSEVVYIQNTEDVKIPSDVDSKNDEDVATSEIPKIEEESKVDEVEMKSVMNTDDNEAVKISVVETEDVIKEVADVQMNSNGSSEVNTKNSEVFDMDVSSDAIFKNNEDVVTLEVPKIEEEFEKAGIEVEPAMNPEDDDVVLNSEVEKESEFLKIQKVEMIDVNKDSKMSSNPNIKTHEDLKDTSEVSDSSGEDVKTSELSDESEDEEEENSEEVDNRIGLIPLILFLSLVYLMIFGTLVFIDYYFGIDLGDEIRNIIAFIATIQ